MHVVLVTAGGHVDVVHAKLETMWKSMICAVLAVMSMKAPLF